MSNSNDEFIMNANQHDLIFHRWSLYFLRLFEYLRTCHNVFVLFSGGTRITNTTVLMVEEISDGSTNDTVCFGNDTHVPIALH